MKDYNVQNNMFIQNGHVIIERLLTETERLKIDRIKDTHLLKFLDHFTSEIEKVKITINKNPRYNWVEIQEVIDNLHARDNRLTSVNVLIEWAEGGGIGYYKHLIKRKKS